MNLLDLLPGIHEAIPAEVYHQRVLGVVNTGALKILHEATPAHYLSWVHGESVESETPALLFGKALHACVLEPDTFECRFALKDFDLRTKAGKERHAELAASGASFIDQDTMDTVRRMRDVLAAHTTASQLLFGGEPETTVTWTDPRTGLLCKARPDNRVRRFNCLSDLKSTDNASPEAFKRAVANFLYHVQAAHYQAGEEASGTGATDFVFVAQEKRRPYAVGIHVLSAAAMLRGQHIREDAMDVLAHCVATDTWPSYPTDAQELDLPPWA